MTRWFLGAISLFVATSVQAQFVGVPRGPPLLIKIDKKSQRMDVIVEGKQKYRWWVSTGVQGLETQSGTYKLSWLDKNHKSKQYDDAPMPYSIFFNRGQAIHGFFGSVGGQASHGCVRLSIDNAKSLFRLVEQQSLSGYKYDTTIVIK